MDDFSLDIGVLGGGQLGRMLIPPALELGLGLHFLDKANACCQSATTNFTEGSILDYQSVYDFANDRVRILTVESENVNTQALIALQAKGMATHPSGEIIQIIQDKLEQKRYLQRHNFPTSDWRSIAHPQELSQHVDFLPAVQKTRRAGYDGRGVQILTKVEDFTQALEAPSFIEPKVDFVKEIAVIVARNERGQSTIYEPVEICQHPTENILEYLNSPADISPHACKQAKEIALELATKLNLVGILAVEMFLLADDSIIINEVAPRPHNSGHHTIHQCNISQFEMHLRAICNWPLPEINYYTPHSVMFNLLAPSNTNGSLRYVGFEKVLEMPDTHLYWYGKTHATPWRKMGHATILAKDSQEAQRRREYLQKILRLEAT